MQSSSIPGDGTRFEEICICMTSPKYKIYTAILYGIELMSALFCRVTTIKIQMEL